MRNISVTCVIRCVTGDIGEESGVLRDRISAATDSRDERFNQINRDRT